jgi:hypothetical protein
MERLLTKIETHVEGMDAKQGAHLERMLVKQ